MQDTLPQFLNGCKSLLENPDISCESDAWKQLEAIASNLPPVGGFIGQLTSEKLLLLALLQTHSDSEKRKDSLKMVFKNILNSVPDINCIKVVQILTMEELNDCLVPYIYDQGPAGSSACYLAAKTKIKLPLQAFSYFLSSRIWSKSDLINLSFLVAEQDNSKLIAQLESSSVNDSQNREVAEEFRYILFNESTSQPLPPDIYTVQMIPTSSKDIPGAPLKTAIPTVQSEPDEQNTVAPSRVGSRKHPPTIKAKPRINKSVTQTEISSKKYAFAIGSFLILPIVLFIFSNQSDEIFSSSSRTIISDKAPEYWIDAITQTKITPKFLEADKDYRMGELFLSRGQYAEAISLFGDAISRDPAHSQALFRLAYCRMSTGDSEGAKTSLARLLKIESRFQLANLLLARIAAKESQLDNAEEFYQKEFALNYDLEVGMEYISFLNQQGKSSQADEILAVLQKKYPDRTIIVQPEKDKSPKREKQ